MKLGAALLAVLSLACAAKAPIKTTSQLEPERLVLDVREPKAFAAGHLPGALNIQLGWDQLRWRTPSYVPDRAQPLAVRAASQSDAEKAAAILLELGYSDFQRIEPGLGEETETLPLMTSAELAKRLGGQNPPLVLDIRTEKEFAKGVIAGALRIDEDQGPEAVRGLDPAGHYAIICAEGWRSSQLATWMRLQGFTDVTNVIDGMEGWDDLP